METVLNVTARKPSSVMLVTGISTAFLVMEVADILVTRAMKQGNVAIAMALAKKIVTIVMVTDGFGLNVVPVTELDVTLSGMVMR